MNKQQLAVLEKAFAEEIDRASIGLIQTKSKVAAQLAEDGYLSFESVTLHGRLPIVVEGYRITHAGILEYCQSIPEGFDIEAAEAELMAEQPARGGVAGNHQL